MKRELNVRLFMPRSEVERLARLVEERLGLLAKLTIDEEATPATKSEALHEMAEWALTLRKLEEYVNLPAGVARIPRTRREQEAEQ